MAGGRLPRSITVILGFAILGCTAVPRTPEEHARALFERYVELGEKYDRALLDLYSGDTRIRRFMLRGTGDTVWANAVDWPTYRAYALSRWEEARARGSRNRYEDVTYTLEGNGVRISMRRYQVPPGVWLGLVLWVWPDADSVWLIRQEIAQLPAGRR